MGFYNTENWPEKSNYYRFPWSNNDNPISWLEVTDVCNIFCKGCYRKHLTGHRPLEELKREVDFFKRVRNTDGISIAGGEPLIYPEIVKLIEYIRKRGIKPIIITNTHALTEGLLRDLYNAGLCGLTCHIDMIQTRPEFEKGSTEIDIMPLRQKKADLIWDVTRGGINVSFNSTVYHENFKYIPDIVKWAREDPKKVHGLVFICYRGIPIKEGVTWDVVESGEKTKEDLQEEFQYTETDTSQIDIMSVDVYNLLKDNFGDSYEPCAYLGGTGHIKHYKWWVAATVLDRKRVYGTVGPRTMEFLQTFHHWRKGTYFAYVNRNTTPRAAMLLTGIFGDRRMRKTRRKLLNPAGWLNRLYTQTIGIVQAPDMMENGMASMCESCPDMCVWEDNLVNSCRLDEYRRYGRLMNAIVHNAADESDKRMAEEETAKT
ncbi:MAG: radical SAM protein [Spirochaetes bacterium]|nr:radical SAM protein [Spirochaetota bacterium]